MTAGTFTAFRIGHPGNRIRISVWPAGSRRDGHRVDQQALECTQCETRDEACDGTIQYALPRGGLDHDGAVTNPRLTDRYRWPLVIG